MTVERGKKILFECSRQITSVPHQTSWGKSRGPAKGPLNSSPKFLKKPDLAEKVQFIKSPVEINVLPQTLPVS